MTARLTGLAALAFLALAAPPNPPREAGAKDARPAPQDQEEQVFADEVRKDYLDKLKKFEDAKDWRNLFIQYDQGLTRYSQKVVAHPERPDVFTSLSEYLLYRFSKLPKEAYEHYRGEFDTVARNAFASARDKNDRPGVETNVDKYFFSSHTDAQLDWLGNTYFEEARSDEAIFYWDRLLRYFPDSRIPKLVTAARIAVACSVSSDEAALAQLKDYLTQAKLDGDVRIGGKVQRLSQYIGSIKTTFKSVGPVSAPKLPTIQGPEDKFRRRIIGVRNDIKRWSYDYTEKGEQAKTEEPKQRIRRMRGDNMAPPANEFPYLPAFARIKDKDYVLATNGYRLIAFNPARVRGENTNGGVYFKYPADGPVKRPPSNSPYSGQYTMTAPFIGCTVDGEFVYATLFSERRPRDTNPQSMDLFDGPSRIVCLHIPTQEVRWDTDDYFINTKGLPEALAKKCDFTDRNYSFASPPIIKGDRLYVGISTSPIGEQEARVLCLNAKTGRPLWCTYLSSVTSGGRNWWGGSGKYVTYLTLLTEHAGVLYAETNLGVVAAVHALTGNILWLTKYKRAMQRNYNYYEPQVIRPPNPPFLNKGVLYILPQDTNDLLAFDRTTGRKIDLPAAKYRDADLPWKNVAHVIGIVEDWMVIGGSESYVVRLKDFRAHNLPNTKTSKCGRGLIDIDGTIYLPSFDDMNATLTIYPGIGSWKLLDQPKWKGPTDAGNLLIAGDYLIVMTDKVSVYTDVETIRQEFVRRIYQSPAHPDSLLEYGDTMRENDRLVEAAESYLAFIRAAEGDSRYETRVRAVKMDLYKIFMKRGEEAALKPDPGRALDFYKIARGFGYNAETSADATRRTAASYEALGKWKEAVQAYQDLIRSAGGQYYRDPKTESVDTIWNHARKKIAEIVQKEASAYDAVERDAKAALDKIANEDVEALRELRRAFPNSKASRDAWKKTLDFFTEKGAWAKVRVLLQELKDWYGQEIDFDQQMRIIELLEKLGDTSRLPYELTRLRDRFSDLVHDDKDQLVDRMIGADGDRETVKEYVERRLREFARRHRIEDAPLRDPLVRLAAMEASKAAPTPTALPVGYVPLRPLGIEPPDYRRALELFRRGSSVELWDLSRHERLWTVVHPGAYLGIHFDDAKGEQAGVTVLDVKKESPADKAGLKQNDILVTIGSSSATTDLLDQTLRDSKAGVRIKIGYRRGSETKDAEIELGAVPVDSRPAIVGSSFTRDYRLAVCWEDGVGSFDLQTGAMEWYFGGIREQFHVKHLFATDGRLYLFEAYRADRPRNPFRVYAQGTRAVEPEDAHARLLCLNDSNGTVSWIRATDFADEKNPQSGQNLQLQFYAKYLSETIALVETGGKQNPGDWAMWVLNAADGQPVKSGTQKISLSLNAGYMPLVTAVDLESGILYYIDAHDQNGRALMSACFDPTRKNFAKIHVILQGKYLDAQNQLCQLAADRDYVCLLVPPANLQQPYRIWVFNAKDGKEFRSINLPENRTLSAAARPEHLLIDEEGILYVYNVPKTGGNVGPTGRGFITAYRIGAANVADILAWDAVAPAMSNGALWSVEPRLGDFVMLYASRGAAPRETGESSLGLLYNRSAGRLQMVFTDLVGLADSEGVAEPSAVFTRGRLFVNTRQGLWIYGN